MTSRNDILTSMRTLTVTTGVLPSMDDIARATGLSKGGLIHHFPTRSALIDGLIGQAIAELDAAMVDAAAAGQAAQTWLRLSVPTGEERELYRAMTVALKALGATKTGSAHSAASAVVSAAMSRWDALLTAELGDATTALVVRLIGDGLFLNALSDTMIPAGRIGEIEQRLAGLGS